MINYVKIMINYINHIKNMIEEGGRGKSGRIPRHLRLSLQVNCWQSLLALQCVVVSAGAVTLLNQRQSLYFSNVVTDVSADVGNPDVGFEYVGVGVYDQPLESSRVACCPSHVHHLQCHPLAYFFVSCFCVVIQALDVLRF